MADLFKTRNNIATEIILAISNLMYSSRESSVIIATGLSGFDSWQRQEMFLYSTASIPALEPTQPPVQLMPGVLSSRKNQPGLETDHSPPSSDEIIYGGAIPPLSHMSSWHSA
jgi:hypothetical protein